MNKLFLLTVIPLLLLAPSARESTHTHRIDDASDWWSSMRTDEPLWDKPDPIRTPQTTLTIAGVSLLDQELLASFTRKFGRTVEVARGDAAIARHQYCYVSSESPATVHRIFEFGEVDSAFYLFADGPDWNGSGLCKRSKLVSGRLSTLSGLHLGKSPSDVERILGKPTLTKGDSLMYVRSVEVKSTPEELKRAKTYAPAMSEDAFKKNYSHYDFSTFIEARFKEGKLSYLAISQSETL